jgi:hypothetical protein
LVALASGIVRVVPPKSLAITVANDGNMNAIPRGVATVTGPNGSVVSRAVLNTESRGVGPGDKLVLTSSLTKLDNSAWPGLYKINLTYGLGGGRAEKTASATFFYIAWWHMVILAALSGIGYYFRRRIRKLLQEITTRRPHVIAARRGVA